MRDRLSLLVFSILVLGTVFIASTDPAVALSDGAVNTATASEDQAAKPKDDADEEEIPRGFPPAQELKVFQRVSALELIHHYQEITGVPLILNMSHFTNWTVKHAYTEFQTLFLPAPMESLSAEMIEAILSINSIELEAVTISDGTLAKKVVFSISDGNLFAARVSSTKYRRSATSSRLRGIRGTIAQSEPEPEPAPPRQQLARFPLAGSVSGRDLVRTLKDLIEKPRAVLCLLGDFESKNEVLVVRGETQQVSETLEMARFIESSLKE